MESSPKEVVKDPNALQSQSDLRNGLLPKGSAFMVQLLGEAERMLSEARNLCQNVVDATGEDDFRHALKNPVAFELEELDTCVGILQVAEKLRSPDCAPQISELVKNWRNEYLRMLLELPEKDSAKWSELLKGQGRKLKPLIVGVGRLKEFFEGTSSGETFPVRIERDYPGDE